MSDLDDLVDDFCGLVKEAEHDYSLVEKAHALIVELKSVNHRIKNAGLENYYPPHQDSSKYRATANEYIKYANRSVIDAIEHMYGLIHQMGGSPPKDQASPQNPPVKIEDDESFKDV